MTVEAALPSDSENRQTGQRGESSLETLQAAGVSSGVGQEVRPTPRGLHELAGQDDGLPGG